MINNIKLLFHFSLFTLVEKQFQMIDENKIKEYVKTNNSQLFFDVSLYYIFSDDTNLLHWAAFYNNRALAADLISIGVDINKQGGKYNSTPIFFALYNSNYMICQLLIKNNANINIKNSYGYTPLHICVQNHDILGFVLILNYGANLNIGDYKERTALAWAKMKNRYNFIDIIERNKQKQRLPILRLLLLILLYHTIYHFIFPNNIFIFLFIIICLRMFFIRYSLLSYLNIYYTLIYSFELLEVNILFLVPLICYLYIIYHLFALRPKLIPKNNSSQALLVIDNLIKLDLLNYKKFCYTCWIEKFSGTSHCSICGGCVSNHDHHCPCLEICISSTNINLFWIYVLFTFILLQCSIYYDVNETNVKFKCLLLLFIVVIIILRFFDFLYLH
ncbi:Palmitoyltransferase AKR1 [Astathelohania contejeani]|uniref:Palmitoyltransferase n=1 Tax=Astathelohania contejeani TaxID=164912 RepID=A0ABQ7I017_9MICR|nr:Palmitoyltransferase AKR1 [Thelohania contejeani]